jgi:hypothetical protein
MYREPEASAVAAFGETAGQPDGSTPGNPESDAILAFALRDASQCIQPPASRRASMTLGSAESFVSNADNSP